MLFKSLLLLAATCLCSATTTPIPPSEDPWYTAPDGFADAAPGTILRQRVAQGNLSDTVDNAAAVYNILYRTTDSSYQPAWAVTTVFVPASPVTTSNGTDGAALLSYQLPYDSAAVDTSPSYAMSSTNTVSSDIVDGLASGWFVNVPDYEGPLASFTAGVQSGHATIDSVRAVLSSSIGLAASADVRYAMWGYSGGALASEWAAELAVKYAPELNFSGAALGGLTPNISNVFTACSGTICAYLLPAGVLGLASQFSAVEAYVEAHLVESTAATFLSVRNASVSEEAAVLFAYQDIFSYFTNGVALLEADIIQKVLHSDGRMGYHGVPTMPLFVYKAVADEVSPVADTDELVESYCEMGASIIYERNTVGGHSAEQYNGGPAAYAWLTEVLGTSYVATTGCTTTETSYNTSTSVYRKRSMANPGSMRLE